MARGEHNIRTVRLLRVAVVIGAMAALPVLAGSGESEGGEEDEHHSVGTVFRWLGACTPGDAGVAYLGVQIREETDHPEGGARVTRVEDDSPAQAAGFQEGDIVVWFGDEVIRGPVRLTRRIHAGNPGDRVRLEAIRDGGRITMNVELGDRADLCPEGLLTAPLGSDDLIWFDEDHRERLLEQAERWGEHAREWAESFDPDEFAPLVEGLEDRLFILGSRPKLGVQLVDVTPELREHLGGPADGGVLVGKVLPSTPAENAGVRVGDLIVAVDGNTVADSGDLVRALRDRDGTTVELEIVRDGTTIRIRATLPAVQDDPTGPRA